jgi:hypothetical protein
MRSLQRRMAVFATRLPETESVVINTIASKSGTVGGATDSAAGAVIALGDSSDSTWLSHTTTGANTVSVTTAGFADLTRHAGRGIASFVVKLRAFSNATATATATFAFTGITPSSSSSGINVSGGVVVNRTSNTFVKSGGGTWTVEEFNAMTMNITLSEGGSGSSETVTLYRVELVVTYA